MVDVVEVVLELEATGFINSGKSTRARVIRELSGGTLRCQFDDGVKGVTEPQGPYGSVEDARSAIVEYWNRCDIALQSAFWKPKPNSWA